MTSVRGERRDLPRAVLAAVFRHARGLRRQVAGDELFLLAVAGLDDDPPARRALHAEGITAERLLTEVRTTGDDVAEPPRLLTYSPLCYRVHGIAEGMAACLGDGTIAPEHILLALVWDPETTSSQLLWRLGASRERIVAHLAASGVPVPPSPLPVQQEVEWGERVWFDRDQVQQVLDHIRENVPAGTGWGFSYDRDRAWAHAEAGVGLEALVREALPPAIALRRIDHVTLAMPPGREDDAVSFYEGALGLRAVPEPEPMARRGGRWFQGDGVRLHLAVEDDLRPGRSARPALLVRGLDLLAERLRQAGVEVRAGEQELHVEDPFGNPIELLERHRAEE